MDTGSTIIGAIILLACIAPFFLIYVSRKRKESLKLQIIKGFAQQNNCEIDDFEFDGDYTIAIDKNQNYIFFIKETKNGVINQFVDLSEIHFCRSVVSTRKVQNGNKYYDVINRAELCFVPKDKFRSEVRFNLFTDDEDMQIDNELQVAEKWSQIINNQIEVKAHSARGFIPPSC
ncbi:hypothetical protein [Natronoflexus pectinivorans]|uniref:Uncharacterized protein n=1 Tax=Natronoflexus pectinivorans TaxID=682526 RepID=A0A4R2GC89_9BACT|nr:hypothetical protein [Natronoflexus pectinivorans]TCO05371.1 hypothetical protein EV194_1163 [Natronoflexus pectinivorans]